MPADKPTNTTAPCGAIDCPNVATHESLCERHDYVVWAAVNHEYVEICEREAERDAERRIVEWLRVDIANLEDCSQTAHENGHANHALGFAQRAAWVRLTADAIERGEHR